MTFRSLLVFFFSAGAAASTVFADITLAPLFRDGAVLQREQPIVVWGRAAAAERVEVKFKSQTASVIAAADGRWRVTLKPEKASATGAEMLVSGANTIRVRDVLVGEVWLCSGQSNMVWALSRCDDAAREIAAAEYPLIRQFKVATVVAEKPAFDVAGSWAACSPATAGNFSGVAYYFARELHERLKVPVGIVNSAWGGTQIESWIGEAALRANPAAKAIFERWEAFLAEQPDALAKHEKAVVRWEENAKAAKAAGKEFTKGRPRAPDGANSHRRPAGLYNAMIAPLVPYPMRGVLWYQGEANGNAGRQAEYAALFTDLIKQWRADFGQPLPFYFVQLANFEANAGTKGDAWAFLREAQAEALALPQTGMAVTIDIGNPKNIHPTNKRDVGQRLALHARKQIYGENLETDGPRFAKAAREGAALRVSFTHAAGLKLEPAKDDGRVAFEVAGEDRKFVPAEARVDGDTLVVQAEAVKAPVAVRYAWRNSPDARLFNSAGLPAASFRSDRW